MTEADVSFLKRTCPDVVLGLMAMQLLLNRISQREETESLLLDTGNTLKSDRSLERAKALEETARKACHEMLRRIGTLPTLDENFEFEVLTRVKPARRKAFAPTAAQTPDTVSYTLAAALLGADKSSDPTP